MAQQSNNSVTRGTLVPDINGINALACKIGRELKDDAISSYLFLNDNKAYLAALGISAALIAELLAGGDGNATKDMTLMAKTGACWLRSIDCVA